MISSPSFRYFKGARASKATVAPWMLTGDVVCSMVVPLIAVAGNTKLRFLPSAFRDGPRYVALGPVTVMSPRKANAPLPLIASVFPAPKIRFPNNTP
ncbi:hypothetical protein D3C71_1319970 [compost metagenome]